MYNHWPNIGDMLKAFANMMLYFVQQDTANIYPQLSLF